MRPPTIDDVFPDYYAELGITPNASPAEVQRSYAGLAHVFRPDSEGSAASSLRMAYIERAYGVLSDRRKRSAYDLLRRAQFGSFILLLVKPTAHSSGRIFLLLLAVLAVLLLISLVALRWEIVMSILGPGSALLALSKALLDWLVPIPDPKRLPVADDGA